MRFDSLTANAAPILLATVVGLAASLLLRALVAWLPGYVERQWREQCSPASEPSPTTVSMASAVSRAPLMLATGVAFGACAWRYGSSWQALAAMGCMATLIALAWIDARTTLLPDVLTLTLLWAGLLFNLAGAFTPLAHAVLGAASGYLLLWLLFHAYRLATAREGMGHGDFKLVAAAGAWVGVESLPFLIVAASLAGVAGALILRLVGRARAGQPLPFGPYIALAFAAILLL